MRIQCPCGARHSIEVTPDMADGPVRFVCPQCGLDSSEAVGEIVRRELGGSPPVGILIPPSQTPADPHGSSRPKIHVTIPSAAASPDLPDICLKHAGYRATHHCLVCGKVMCPKCMEVFGYVCSPHCRARAEAQGIEVPVFEGQRSVAEARHWRKVAMGAAGIGAAVVALLGVWIWYAWVGSHPSPVYTVQFNQGAYTGQSFLCGTDQLVLLHGTTLARHDLKTKKPLWSRRVVGREIEPLGADEELVDFEELFSGAALKLWVCQTNIWVAESDKVIRYDWATGTPAHTVRVPGRLGEFVREGDDLVLLAADGSGSPMVHRINLLTGAARVNAMDVPARQYIAGREAELGAQRGAGAGLPIGVPGADRGQPLDPARVAAEAQRLSLPARIALPAVLAGNISQERILAELEEEDFGVSRRSPEVGLRDYVSVFPRRDGDVQFSVRLLEKRLVSRKAMKDPPKRSVLENVNVTQSMEVAGEILNDLQRMRGGEMVIEDESRYLITVRMDNGKTPDWTGEVVGRPVLFPLKTVNVIAAGKLLLVLDKSNRKLWQAALSFPLPPQRGGVPSDDISNGSGPCVERDGCLYVFDPAVLAAFDLRTGNARWRLPTTGATALFFDEAGMLYVNTTTASPENVRFSRQIDMTERIRHVVLKVDPATGRTIWAAEPGGAIACVSGKFIYTLRTTDGPGAHFGRTPLPSDESPSFLKIKRLHPEDGRILWEHLQQRAPLDVQFNRNSIQVVFKNEVQVLRFLSF